MSLGTVFTHTELTVDQARAQVAKAAVHPCVSAFHQHWYASQITWGLMRYRGLPVLKCPFDLWMYHELIMQVRPRLIIETGTAYGGSAVFFGDQLAMAGGGRVVTIDVDYRKPTFDDSPTIRRLQGLSLSTDILDQVRGAVIMADGPVMVSLDSDHAHDHVRAELEAYATFVTPGSYLVVEDTNLGGNPVTVGVEDGGPRVAVSDFLTSHPEFTQDQMCERFLMTWHPGGWLQRTVED